MNLEEQKEWEERKSQRDEFGLSNVTRKLVVKYIRKKEEEGGTMSKEGLLSKLRNRKKQ